MIPADLLPHLSSRVAAIVGTETIDVLRDSPQSDGMGGQTNSWRRVATGVVGAVTFSRVAEELGAEAIQNVGEWVWALPIGTDVRANDRIESSGGAVYEVVGTDASRSQALMLTVRCNLYSEGEE